MATMEWSQPRNLSSHVSFVLAHLNFLEINIWIERWIYFNLNLFFTILTLQSILAYRCCYCGFFNTARKQRLNAPRLERISHNRSRNGSTNSTDVESSTKGFFVVFFSSIFSILSIFVSFDSVLNPTFPADICIFHDS